MSRAARRRRAEDQQYTYKTFSHWNPYPHGLPELWSYCRMCQEGTDGYTFAGDETIQPELINLARFVLSYIGSRYNHSPKNRAQVPRCCFDMPIRFRWSGSAPWPLYVGGGKDATAHIHPLHNLDDGADLGSALARMSWRGAGKLWPSNPEYGPGESWLPIPEQLGIERFAFKDRYSCKVYWSGRDRGLRVGDVIEAAHLEEIIAAIDYLIDEGLWRKQPIKSRVATPTWEIGGYRCGHYHLVETGYPDRDPVVLGEACCYQIIGDVCVPFTVPTDWADCWQEVNDPGDLTLESPVRPMQHRPIPAPVDLLRHRLPPAYTNNMVGTQCLLPTEQYYQSFCAEYGAGAGGGGDLRPGGPQSHPPTGRPRLVHRQAVHHGQLRLGGLRLRTAALPRRMRQPSWQRPVETTRGLQLRRRQRRHRPIRGQLLWRRLLLREPGGYRQQRHRVRNRQSGLVPRRRGSLGRLRLWDRLRYRGFCVHVDRRGSAHSRLPRSCAIPISTAMAHPDRSGARAVVGDDGNGGQVSTLSCKFGL